ncbi:MAG: antibiotic biosynthesis monooxygenase [Phycisphaerales bacterium]|nr:antibiotic biosynthesis monooxygenase [Phycisphaerales bacterium]
MVTIGMNYRVVAGNESVFETMFAKVLEIMGGIDGHEHTELFSGVQNPQHYLIVSRWSDKAAFDAFTSSKQFANVTDWGKRGILAERPTHEVYGDNTPTGAKFGAMPAGCPVHA